MTSRSLHLVFALEDQRYALALHVVERVLPMVRISPLPKAPAIALGVINLHGTLLPVLDIRRRFRFAPRGFGLKSRLVVAQTSRRVVVLPVDEVDGVQEIHTTARTPAEAILPGIGHVAGIVALPDGLLFIHDLETFLGLEEEQQLAAVLKDAEP